MKKAIKFIIIFVILLLLIWFFLHTTVGAKLFADMLYKNKYYSRKVLETTSQYNCNDKTFTKSFISENDFSVQLSNIDYDKENGNLLNLTFDFTNNKNPDLSTVGFVLEAYDKNGSICCQNLGSMNYPTGSELVQYVQYYSSDLYGEDYLDINLMNLDNLVKITHDYPENGNYITRNLTLDLPDDYEINGDLNIVLFDLQYQNTGDSNYYKVINPLGEYKFTINFIK